MKHNLESKKKNITRRKKKMENLLFSCDTELEGGEVLQYKFKEIKGIFLS